MLETGANYLAVIKVVGVGGGGTNAVNRMVEAGVKGVEFIAVNTDAQALLDVRCGLQGAHRRRADQGSRCRRRPRRGLPGSRGEQGRDQGGAPGRRHGLHHGRSGRRHRYRCALRSSRRSPRRRSARSRSRSSRDRSRSKVASVRFRPRKASSACKEHVDTLIIIPNDRLLQVAEKKTSILDAFRIADDVLRQGCQGITDLITVPGPHQPRLRRRAHGHEGRRHGAHGHRCRHRRQPGARGREGRDREPAARVEHRGCQRCAALASPAVATSGCSRSTRLPRSCRRPRIPDANIIFGAVIDDSMMDQIRVTVIATGFGGKRRQETMEFEAAVAEDEGPRIPDVRDAGVWLGGGARHPRVPEAPYDLGSMTSRLKVPRGDMLPCDESGSSSHGSSRVVTGRAKAGAMRR